MQSIIMALSYNVAVITQMIENDTVELNVNTNIQVLAPLDLEVKKKLRKLKEIRAIPKLPSIVFNFPKRRRS